MQSSALGPPPFSSNVRSSPITTPVIPGSHAKGARPAQSVRSEAAVTSRGRWRVFRSAPLQCYGTDERGQPFFIGLEHCASFTHHPTPPLSTPKATRPTKAGQIEVAGALSRVGTRDSRCSFLLPNLCSPTGYCCHAADVYSQESLMVFLINIRCPDQYTILTYQNPSFPRGKLRIAENPPLRK